MSDGNGTMLDSKSWIAQLQRDFSSDHRRRVEDYFVAQPALAENAEQAIRLIYAEFCLREAAGEQPSAAEYNSRFPQFRAQLAPIFEVHSALRESKADNTDADQTLTHVPGQAIVEANPFRACAADRFQVLRSHAKGGLGEVFVAIDSELRREVAIKSIQPRFAHDAASRQRFLTEAEITGALEHPGVVPVYSLGSNIDGQPYYAMRFIQGESLKEAIARLHQGSTPKRRGFDRLEFRKLLVRFVAVCNTIAYAHSRGIVHRDLKPSNIMLGDYGETLVVDWGLAKSFTNGEVEDVEQPVSVSQSHSNDSLTQTGMVVGTPQYMSPEQAAGRVRELGPASDIYSLGATLFSLLTGQAPVAADEMGELFEMIRGGKIRSVRALNPRVSPALAAICHKAMALAPRDRYASAKEFADDLEHWLAEEPVSAYAESTFERAARASRRHRGAVIAGIVSLVLITALSTTATVLVNQQRGIAETERLAADKARVVANEQRQYAQDQQKVAEGNAELARERLYVSDMNLLPRLWNESSMVGLRQTLARQVPQPGQRDLRGFEWHYWNRAAHSEMQVLDIGNICPSVAISPDGSHVVTVDWGGTIWNLDLDDPKSRRTIKASSQGLESVALSRDGKLLAAGGRDKTVHVFEFATGRKLHMLEGHAVTVQALAFSPDRTRLATGGFGDELRIWDLEPGKLVVSSGASSKYSAMGLAYSHDGKQIAVARNPLTIVDAETLREIKAFKGIAARTVCYSDDDSRLVVASPALSELTVKVVEVESQRLLANFQGHEGLVYSATFLADANQVASVSADGTVRVWNVDSGESRIYRGHGGYIYGLAYNRPRNQIASASWDKSVRIWDPNQDQRSRTLKTGNLPSHPALSPDGAHVAAGDGNRTVMIWNVQSGAPVASFTGHAGSIWQVAYSSDGKLLATASNDKTARILDAKTCRELHVLRGHADYVNGVAFRPGAEQLVTASWDKQLIVWDAKTGEQVRKLTGSPSRVTTVAYSHDGRFIASAGNESAVRVWDAETGKLLHSLKCAGAINAVAISPDRQFIAAVSNTEQLVVWEFGTGKRVLNPKGHSGIAYGVAFSPDGTRLATAGDDKVIKVWDSRTGEELLALRGHTDGARGVVFSRDGQLLVSSARDSTLRLWDARPIAAAAARPQSTTEKQ